MADAFKTIKVTQLPGGPLQEQLVGVVSSSAGTTDAGKVVLTNASGQIDSSMVPSSGSVAFNGILSGTNTAAAMVVGTGSSLTFTGSGVVNANEWNGTPITGSPTLGKIPIGQGSSAVWADPVVQGVYADGTNVASPSAPGNLSTIQPVYVGGKRTDNGNLQGVSLDASGNLNVNVQVGGGGGGSNVTIVNPIDGGGNVKVSIENSPTVSVSNFPATQPVSGTVSVTGTVTANAGTGTFHSQDLADGTTGSAVPSTAIYIAANKSGNLAGLSLDTSGNLNVNVAAGSGSNPAAGATGSAVPGSADYNGINVGGTLRGQTGANPSGAIFAAQSDIASIAGTTIDTNSGSKSAGTIRVVLATDQPQLTNALKVDGSGVVQPVSGTVTANQGGAPWSQNLTQIAGSSVSTAATGVIKVGIVGNAGASFDVVQSGATAATNAIQIAGVFNTVAPTLTNGQAGALQIDSTGILKVNVAAGSSGNAAASATGAAVPVDADYIGFNSGGNLVGVSSGNPLPVTFSGTVAVTQSTSPWVVSLTSTTITGTVAVTQSTTPWTIQGDSASGAANAGNPVKAGGVFNTTQPTVTTGQTVDVQATARGAQIVATGVDTFNVTVNAALPAGTNVIGHVIIDSGSTTVVTGTVAVTQSGTWTVQQGGAPWSQNLTQIAGTSLGATAVTNFGTAPATAAVPGVNASLFAGTTGITATGSSVNANITNTVAVTLTSTTITGTVAVTQSTSPWVVAGNVASGASDSGNPIKVGGIFNTTQPTVTNAQRVDMQSTARGAQIVATGVDTFNVVASGTVAVSSVSGTVAVTQSTSPWVVSLTSTTITGTVAVTQSGTWNIATLTTITNPVTIVGDAASGAAKAGNPVQTGAVFNTTQPTVTTGQVVESQSTARGAQIVATGVDTFNVTVNAALPAGTNVIGHVITDTGSTTVVTGTVAVTQSGSWTNTVTQATAASLNATVVGTGTFAVQATQSGTWTVQQGSAPWSQVGTLTHNNATPGTNNIGVLPAVASTAAPTYTTGDQVLLSTDLAGNLRVAGSLSVTSADTVGTPGTLNGANTTATVATAGSGGAGVLIASGTLAATVVPEVSYDGGITWVATVFYDPVANTTSANLVFTNPNLATTRSILIDGGVSNARVRVSAFTSGTATATLRATFNAGGQYVNQGGTWAVSVPGTVAVTQSTSPWVVSLTSTTITGTVAVTQSGSWTQNLTQVAGTSLGATAVTNFGTAPAAAAVPGVNASLFAGTTGITATGSSINANITNTVPVTLTSTTITGTVAVTQSTSPWVVAGNVASGASDSGSPVKVGGVFNTTQPTVTNGQRVDMQSSARGAQIVATGVDTFNVTVNAALPAGTNVIGHVITDSGSTTVVTGTVAVTQSGTWTVQPGNTPNTTPWLFTISQGGNNATVTAGNALKVDGSAVTQPVSQATAANLNATVVGTGTFAVQAAQSGTWTVQQGTAPWSQVGTLTHNNAAPVANNVGVLPAVASTSAPTYTTGDQVLLSTDLAGNLRVAGTLAVTTADTVGTLVALNALNVTSTVATTGQGGAGVLIAAGTLAATVVAEVSYDGGTTWVASVFFDPTANTTSASLVFTNPNSATTRSILIDGGVSNVRVRVSVFTSGTANATLRSTFNAGGQYVNQGGTWSVSVPGTVAVIQSTSPWVVSGTVTANAGTGNFTVVQGTAASLNATVVGTGTFAVQAAQSGTWNIATVTAVTAITNALPAGTNVIGHVITDTGSTTVVTGTVAQNLTQVAGTTLGATAVTNFGTAPAAAAVMGVNASVYAGTTGITATGSSINANITNTVPVTLTSTTITGTVAVTQSTSPWTTQGASASGSAKSGNPTQIGGVFNTTQPTVTTGQTVEAQSTARGALLVATGVDTFNVTVNTALPAGTNVIGHVIIDSGSTTVVTGTVAVTQSGTWTVQPGNTPNTTPWLFTINQGGNSASVTAGNALKVDGSAVTQPVSLTSTTITGTVAVTQSTTPWTIQGDVASAGANAGNPVKTGGVFNTTQPTVTNGQIVDAQSTARGALIVATGVDAFAVSGTVIANQGGAPWTQNLTQVAGTSLGATAVTNFGTAPAAAAVPGVNASLFAGTTGVTATGSSVNANITNTVAVTLTSTTITGTVAVTQSTSPWVVNMSQWGGTTLGTPTAFGTTPGAVVAGSANVSLFQGTAIISNTNPTFASITDGTTKATVIAATAALKTDLSSVAGTATVTAAAGVQKVGIVGSTNATLDSTNAAATAPTNALLTSAMYNSTIPALTTGQAVALESDTTGSLYVDSEGRKQTYRCGIVNFTPIVSGGTAPFVSVTGSATKTIRITRIRVSASAGTGTVADVSLVKFTALSGGTANSQSANVAKMDSNNAAQTAVVNQWSVAATTHTGAGVLNAERYEIVTAAVSVLPGAIDWTFGDKQGQGLVLRGTSEFVGVLINAVGTTPSADCWVEWTEES